ALPFVAPGLRPQVHRPFWRGHHAALRGVVGGLIAITIGLCVYDPFPIHGEIKLEQAAGTPAQTAEFPEDDWTAYGGNNFGQRYSSLQDINVDNISQLKLAWSYNTGDLRQSDDAKEYTFEATPLKVNNTLYFCTPHNRV